MDHPTRMPATGVVTAPARARRFHSATCARSGSVAARPLAGCAGAGLRPGDAAARKRTAAGRSARASRVARRIDLTSGSTRWHPAYPAATVARKHGPTVPDACGGNGLLAVALGAFGAHGLRARLAAVADAAQRLGWWDTAAHYHLMHALALGLSQLLAARAPSTALQVAGFCFLAGIALFSGSLYAMTLTRHARARRDHTARRPRFLVGWAAIMVSAPMRAASSVCGGPGSRAASLACRSARPGSGCRASRAVPTPAYLPSSRRCRLFGVRRPASSSDTR